MYDPAVESAEELSDVGGLVVIAPSPDHRVEVRDHEVFSDPRCRVRTRQLIHKMNPSCVMARIRQTWSRALCRALNRY